MKEKLKKILKEPILCVLVVCVIFQIKLWTNSSGYVMYPDSGTYIGYSANIFKGELDALRTPIYPYFIKIIKAVLGEENLENRIVYAQYGVMFISIIFFYFTIKRITKNKIISSISTLIYGICPFIFTWNNVILTESISISAIVLLCFLTTIYLEKPRKVLAAIIGLFPFILVMIRPAFLYVLALYIVFWILKLILDKLNKNEHLIGMIFTIISVILILIYCGLMKKNYNVFGMTTISSLNNNISMLESNTYYNAGNKEILNTIEQLKQDGITDTFAIDEKLHGKYSDEEIDEFFENAKKNNLSGYCKYIIKKVIALAFENVGTSYAFAKDNSQILYMQLGYATFPISFYQLYILLAGSIIFVLWDLIKNKNINYIFSFFTLMILANLVISIIAAPYETQRLVSASVPIILMLISYIISSVYRRYKISE